MKKVIITIVVLLFVASAISFAQSMTTSDTTQAATKDSSDFFIGQWDLVFYGTPQGDSKLVATLERKEGKLTGHMVNPSTPDQKNTSRQYKRR